MDARTPSPASWICSFMGEPRAIVTMPRSSVLFSRVRMRFTSSIESLQLDGKAGVS